MRALLPKDAAEYAGVSLSCLRRWEARGLIRKHMDSKEVLRYLITDLDKIILNRPKRGRKKT